MSSSMEELLAIMARLRDPAEGCPWDLRQTFASIVPHTLEEAYELADAIERGDMPHVKEELGDLLFQIVFYVQMAREQQLFSFDDVARGLAEKLVRRHPHVFARPEGEGMISEEQVKQQWEYIKKEERTGKTRTGLFADIPSTLPALSHSLKLQRRAANAGLDWGDARQVIHKVREELDELEAELDRADDTRLSSEMGDVLFAAINLARHVRVDPEQALRACNRRFVARCEYIETRLHALGKDFGDVDVDADALDQLWREAKQKGL